jgi:hypothetical protein
MSKFSVACQMTQGSLFEDGESHDTYKRGDPVKKRVLTEDGSSMCAKTTCCKEDGPPACCEFILSEV